MSNSRYLMTGLIFSVSFLLVGCSLWGGDDKELALELDTEILPELKLPEGLTMPERSDNIVLPDILPASLPVQSSSPEPPSLTSVPGNGMEESIELPAEMPHSYLTEEDGDVVLLLEEKFDYAWHRLELSLERIYLQVEDRDRTAGIYYIGQIKDVEEGTSWFNTVFRDEDEADKYRFRIVMKQDDNTEKVVTRVVIRDEKGKAEKDKIARKVLSKILEGMK